MQKPYYILCIILLLFMTACGSNQHASSDTGSISFKLQLSRPTTTSRAEAATSADICTDYGITTINASVLNLSGAIVATGSWLCSTHQGIVTGVPAGSNYTVKLEGIDSNDAVEWTGEKTDISITGGSTTDADTITMTYVGSDTTPPTVTSTNPSDGAANVPVTILITATLNEEMAISSINTVTFTVKNGTTPVNGSVTYDSNTKKAIFIPPDNLSYSTTYTATITAGVEDMAGNNMQSDASWSFTTEDPPTTKPSAPTGVNATAGNGQVTITWDAVGGATSYNIYWSTMAGVIKANGTKISNVTSPYIHSGRTNGTTYYYVVTAENDNGESSESAEGSAKPGVTDTTPPTGSIIINNNATYTNSTTVNLTLSAIDSSGVSQMCINNENTCPSSSWEAYTTSKSWILTTGDGTKTVYAWFKDGAGNVSVVETDTIILTTIPSGPTGVSAVAGNGQATITWDAITDATSYNIYWSTTSGVTKSTGTKISGITATSYTNTGLTNGTAYYYVVSAANDYGESGESNQVMVIPPQIPISLPKTGQTTCYDSSGNGITCAGTGQDGDLQRGVAWPNPRFIDNGDGTVTDNLTGLVWTKDGNAPGPAACSPAGSKTWQAALDYVACLNANSYLGYTDWRLPNIVELESVIDAEQWEQALPAGNPFTNVQGYDYWSSTSSTYNGINGAWVVSMGYGNVASFIKTNFNYVWPVRSGQSWLFGSSIISLSKTGQTTCYDGSGNVITCAGTGQDGDNQSGVTWPNPRFIDNGDDTVTDNLTGLVWTKDGNAPGPAACSPAGSKTWQAALDYVACLNANSYLGYTNWRLPNINELGSLLHYGKSNLATWLNTQGFNNVRGYYWSSTTHASNSIYAWVVGVGSGVGAYYKSDGSYYYVWPVRSGQ